jgi:hypothetical protein
MHCAKASNCDCADPPAVEEPAELVDDGVVPPEETPALHAVDRARPPAAMMTAVDGQDRRGRRKMRMLRLVLRSPASSEMGLMPAVLRLTA